VGSLSAVLFRAPGAPPSGDADALGGRVDYRLDRRRTLRALRAGEVSREDVCDAQSELLRVGRECSTAARTACPVCDERALRRVRFVFGPRLPSGGRAITSQAELERLATKAGEHRCFEVEVCLECRWNHLLATYVLRPRSAS